MFLRCLLVPTAAGVDATRRLDAGLRLSRRLHAHLNVLFVSPEPELFFAALPEVAIAAGVTIESIRREASKAARAGKTALDAWCRHVGIPAETSDCLNETFATWSEQTGSLETLVALAGRVSDLIIIDKPDSAEPFGERVFDTAVFSAGRPALVVPETVPDDLLRHVVIAWNGSLEAARVIGLSITLLHEADRVTVIQARDDGAEETRLADLTGYLRWHGIVAGSLEVARADGKTLGESILAGAERIDATMLVMGAYTHSRIRQFLLGGVTREVVARTRIPLLMAH